VVNPFAVRADLELALKRTFDPADEAWADDLLEQASDHLRSEVLHWQVYPPVAASYDTWLRCGTFYRLPVQPASLVGVTWQDTGLAAETQAYDGGFKVCGRDGIATVSITGGYAAAPKALRSWTITLAAQVIQNIEKLKVLTTDAYSSVGIDDFKMVWNQNGSAGWGIPERAAEALRDEFGTSVFLTGRG
jgi:hypothetical protein